MANAPNSGGTLKASHISTCRTVPLSAYSNGNYKRVCYRVNRKTREALDQTRNLQKKLKEPGLFLNPGDREMQQLPATGDIGGPAAEGPARCRNTQNVEKDFAVVAQ